MQLINTSPNQALEVYRCSRHLRKQIKGKIKEMTPNKLYTTKNEGNAALSMIPMAERMKVLNICTALLHFKATSHCSDCSQQMQFT